MSEEEPEEETPREVTTSGELSSSSGTEHPRRKPITPEQRRVLGQPRSRHDQRKEPEKPAQAPPPGKVESVSEPPPREPESGRRKAGGWRPSRTPAMQNFALVIGALFLLAMMFYVGKRYEYWKYTIVTHRAAKLSANESNKFPGTSAEELVKQALITERLGKWQDAAERYIAAKYKDLSYAGILFRVGKIYYDHGDFASADTLFERAIAFSENIDSANYYRGMIALGREDFPAAEHYFETAAKTAPFNADYFYSLAETFRKDRHPNEAIASYEQAAARAAEPEEIICRFKIRMATVETGEVRTLSAELEKKRAEGPLSVDWLMTAAALQGRAGNIDGAINLVKEARAADQSRLFSLFAACAGDRLFTMACRDYPDLAQACRIEAAPAPTPP
jgi:tetratricopeptide (TPR) repeat protein